jgi:uncharacterized glyoxalase superfamily protein PhnB
MQQPSEFKIQNRAMPPSSIIPVLGYDDVNEAKEWLIEVFGFTERWYVEGHRAQLSFGNGAVVVTENRSGSATVSLLVRVSSVAEHFMHVYAKGATILQPPTDFPYGERQYVVEDIGGHIWNFSESIKDVVPESFGGVSKQL